MRVAGCNSCPAVKDVRPSEPSGTPVWLTATMNEDVSDEPSEKSVPSEI